MTEPALTEVPLKLSKASGVAQYGTLGAVVLIAYQAIGMMEKLDDRFVAKEVYQLGNSDIVRAVERLDDTLQASIKDDRDTDRQIGANTAAISALQAAETYRRTEKKD